MAPKTKIFVGRLPDGCTNSELQALFEKYGTVTECDVINKYGFVHMKCPEEADVAIKALHNSPFMGSSITVEQSHSRHHLEPGAPGRARGDQMSNGFMPRGPPGPSPFRNGFPPRSFGPRNGFGPRGGLMNGRGYGNTPDAGYRGRYDGPPRDPYYEGFRERPRPYPMPFERRGPLPPPQSQRDDLYSHRPLPPDDLYSRRPSYEYGSGYDYEHRRSPPSDYLYSRRSPPCERPLPPPSSMRRPAYY